MTPESNSSPMDAQIVGNAFVQKYYTHLYKSPAEVHRFYLEASVLGRPGLDGEMVSYNSLKAINEQIMSLDYQKLKIQILSADSQASLNDAVATLVTGFVIGNDGERKAFTQSFFLVPQKGSYFVLNDVFRYVADECVEPESTKEVEESHQPITPSDFDCVEPESTKEVEKSLQLITPSDLIAEPVNEVVEAVVIPSQVTKPASAVANGHEKVHNEKAVNGNSNLPKAAEAKPQEDAPKRSYAVIVQSLAQNGTPFNVKASPAKPKPVEKLRVAPEPKAPAPVAERSSAKTIEQPGQGGCIFVANLPMDATPEQLYETFKGFGAIREGGIQVRSYTETRNCFGFVTFENGEAVKNVLQAQKENPIRIGNRRANIEEKRGNNNENGGRASARNNGNNRNENGYRNGGDRPRGNGVNGGRGQGRNGSERRNGEAAGDAKASRTNGHGNAQATN